MHMGISSKFRTTTYRIVAAGIIAATKEQPLTEYEEQYIQVHEEKVNRKEHIIRKINKQSNANVIVVNLNIAFFIFCLTTWEIIQSMTSYVTLDSKPKKWD